MKFDPKKPKEWFDYCRKLIKENVYPLVYMANKEHNLKTMEYRNKVVKILKEDVPTPDTINMTKVQAILANEGNHMPKIAALIGSFCFRVTETPPPNDPDNDCWWDLVEYELCDWGCILAEVTRRRTCSSKDRCASCIMNPTCAQSICDLETWVKFVLDQHGIDSTWVDEVT